MDRQQNSEIDDVKMKIKRKETLLKNEKIINRLPDKGKRIRTQMEELKRKLKELESPLTEKELSEVIEKYKKRPKTTNKPSNNSKHFQKKYEDAVMNIITRQEKYLKKRRVLNRTEEKKRMESEIEFRKGKLASESEKKKGESLSQTKRIRYINEVVQEKKEETEETEGEEVEDDEN